MKKIAFAVLSVAVVASSFTACTKKGADDPMISLRSRDSRIIGEYTMTGYTYNDMDKKVVKTPATGTQGGFSKTTVVTTTGAFAGGSYDETVKTDWSTTESGLPAGAPTSMTITQKSNQTIGLNIEIVKDGTYTWSLTGKSSPNNMSIQQSSTLGQACGTGMSPLPIGGTSAGLTCDGTYNYTYPASYDSKDEGQGEWYWENSNNNKTEIVFTNGPLAGRWDVLQLKNKETKLQLVTSTKSTSPDPAGTDLEHTHSEVYTISTK